MIHATDIRTHLAECTDTAEAARYIAGLALTVAQLRTLAGGLEISIPSRAPKADVIRMIVRWTVGVRLTSIAISRPAYLRER